MQVMAGNGQSLPHYNVYMYFCSMVQLVIFFVMDIMGWGGSMQPQEYELKLHSYTSA